MYYKLCTKAAAVLTDLNTVNLEPFADRGEDAAPQNSETVSNPSISRNISPSVSSFTNNSAESTPRRRPRSGINSKDGPQASIRRCASLESLPAQTAPFRGLRRRCMSESYASYKPDSLWCRITVCPFPNEVFQPTAIWQQEEREEMKRKAQREREQAARVTKLGLDCNVLIKREEYSLENYLSTPTKESNL